MFLSINSIVSVIYWIWTYAPTLSNLWEENAYSYFFHGCLFFLIEKGLFISWTFLFYDRKGRFYILTILFPPAKLSLKKLYNTWQKYCSNLPPVKCFLELQQWLSGQDRWWWWRSCAWWVLYLWLHLVALLL